MKKITFLIMLAIIGLSANAQWQKTNGPYGVSINCFAINGSNIFAGTDDGSVFLSSDNGNNWNLSGTLGSNNEVWAFAISGSNIFAGTIPSSGIGGVYLSSNNGVSWAAVNNGLINPPTTYCYVYALAISGSNIFAGGYPIYLSTNNGNSWAATSFSDAYGIYTLAISGSNIFAGCGDGVYLSSDNGINWAAVNNGLPTEDKYINTLAISGSNIFAGTDYGVYLSTNNGSSWAVTALSNFEVRSIIINGNNIYAGTDDGNGVFLSTNNGNSWTALGLTSRQIYSLAISGSNLFAGTDSLVWKETVTGLEEINNESNIAIYPNPACNNLTIESPQDAVIEITNIQGQLVKTFTTTGNKTNIDVSALPSGVYFIKATTEKGIAVKKLIKE